ncbi:MAG: hypothetical protein WDO24_11655 [Pseudomonadota bacterium]
MLWKADVTARPSAQDERALPARLAAILVDNIGRAIDTRKPPDAPPPTPGGEGYAERRDAVAVSRRNTSKNQSMSASSL